MLGNVRNIKLVVTVKLGIGGFSMGAATALYSASCYAYGRYGNSNLYPVNLSAVIGLSGWLPCSRYVQIWHPSILSHISIEIKPFVLFHTCYICRTLKYKVESSQDAARRAASLPLLVCHGRGIHATKLLEP